MANLIERMESLIKDIEFHNHQYYTMDTLTINDKEWARLFDEHRHLSRLWSLDKAQNMDELNAWHARAVKLVTEYNTNHPSDPLPPLSYVIELKFDGLTLNLTYDQGNLVQASTRGTGVIGEGILAQVKTIRSISLQILYREGILEIQGEGIMHLSTLE